MIKGVAMIVLIALLISACSAPVRAPVVSRERGYTSPRVTTISQSSHRTQYRVRPGDTLYSIAWKFGLEYHRLAAWNGIRSPYTIYPGQLLRLRPARGKVAKSGQVARPSTAAKTGAGGSASNSREVLSRPTRSASSSSSSRGRTEPTRSATLKLRWIWPTKGKTLQGFNGSDPSRKGIKISGRFGQPIVAAESGRVVYAGSGLLGYGRLIIIKHTRNYLSAYGYNKKILVKEGQSVKKGEPVAEMGRKGGGEPMLHFEIRRNGAPVDPVKLLPRRR